jgi:hypothetical protein
VESADHEGRRGREAGTWLQRSLHSPTPTLKMLLVKTLGYAFCDYMVFEAAGLQSSLKILEEVRWSTDEH